MPAPDTEARKTRFSYWRGYPARYREMFLDEAKRAAVAVALLLLLPLGGRSPGSPVPRGCRCASCSAWRCSASPASVGSSATARCVRCSSRESCRTSRRTWASQRRSAAAPPSRRTRSTSTSWPLPPVRDPLSSFGFDDDFYGQSVKWHEPALAIATIKVISPQVSAEEPALRRDLEALSEFWAEPRPERPDSPW